MTAETRPVVARADAVGRVKWGMCAYCLGPLADGDRHDVTRDAAGAEVCVITRTPSRTP